VFFLASYWSAKFGTFVQTPIFSSYWLEDFADGTPTTGENYQYSATHCKSQTLSSQPCLALAARNI
jgi:hypothetical protein